MYLKIERAAGTVVGESTDAEHKDQLEIISYSHGQSQHIVGTTSSAGGRTAERVNHGDFSVTKYMDKSTPVLNQSCSEGECFKILTIQLYRATADGGKPVKYMEYILTDAIISSYSVSGSSMGVPTENLSFNYATIKWAYIPQKKEAPGGPDTAIPGGWSLKENKKI
jgi:type VI secretion system secreted protein Hcp